MLLRVLCLIAMGGVASASAYAQTEAPQEPEINCAAVLLGTRGTYQTLFETTGTYNQQIRQFNAAVSRAKNERAQYRQYRRDGNMPEAERMASVLDGTWSEIHDLQNRLKSLVRTGQSQANDWCSAIASAAAQGCPNAKMNASCSDYRNQWQSISSASVMTETRYATTWRGPDDYDFSMPDAACEVAEGDVPGLPPQTISAVSGRAFVVRGLRSYPATPGMQVNPGDVIAVEDASSVSLMLHSGELKLVEKTKFEIPQPVDPNAGPDTWAKINKNLVETLNGMSQEEAATRERSRQSLCEGAGIGVRG